MSNLKLQKLLYYTQGFHLALMDGAPLFTDRIEAWRHGPVVCSMYPQYARYGSGAIPCPTEFDDSSIPADTRDILDEVYEVYGQYSAWKLREMTHAEPPWRDAWDPDDPSRPISLESMKNYFSTLVDEET